MRIEIYLDPQTGACMVETFDLTVGKPDAMPMYMILEALSIERRHLMGLLRKYVYEKYPNYDTLPADEKERIFTSITGADIYNHIKQPIDTQFYMSFGGDA